MKKEEILRVLNKMSENTLMKTLGIEYCDVDLEQGYLEATMPVNPSVHQPMGLLHGGASAALAESLGSAASAMMVDPEKFAAVGIELSCNHVRSKRDGQVKGEARLIHKGRSTHLWSIEIKDEKGQLISHCKLNNMIIPRRKEKSEA